MPTPQKLSRFYTNPLCENDIFLQFNIQHVQEDMFVHEDGVGNGYGWNCDFTQPEYTTDLKYTILIRHGKVTIGGDILKLIMYDTYAWYNRAEFRIGKREYFEVTEKLCEQARNYSKNKKLTVWNKKIRRRNESLSDFLYVMIVTDNIVEELQKVKVKNA